MKQKPVFLKHLTCIVSIASLLIPAANILQLNSILFSNEGNHPKNVVLHSPDAITCMDPKTFYVGSDCMAEVLDTVPKSNGTITSLSYSINGGSTVALTSPFPATISLGLRRIDTVQIVWQVQDNLGANATCTHIKYVRDTISPIIICPTNITVGTDNDGRRAALRNPLTTVDFGPPTFSDNCGSTDLVWVNNHTGTKDTIGRFPIGTTTVCWTVRDASLNSVECCHTVTVVDNVRPVIVCPDTIKTQCSLLPIYANFAQFSAAGGYATDDVKLDTMSFRRVRDITIDSTCLYRKTIHRQYTISDSTGNADTCFQVIVMRDTTPPTPVCKDITIDLNSAGNASITADQLNNNSTDNCGGTLIFTSMPSNLFFSCNDVSTSPVPITLIVTDLCGNSATCRANVTVRDLVLPTITCPANITIDANINQCFTTNVTLGNPSAQDNCPPVTGIVPYFNGNIFSGSTQLPVGTNTIIWIVTDKNNNTNSCSQQVTVKDNTSPTITCPANITLTAPTGTCAAIVNYTPPSGNDACLGASTVLVSGLASGSMFPVGVTTNIFRVTDISGNSATCSFTVNVIDSQLPIITCPPNITVTAPTTTCSALVNYTTPVGTDVCPGAVTTQIQGNASGTNFNMGVTTNTFRVTDASGNSATCSFTVTVTDNSLPTISCPPNITASAQSGACSATVLFTPPVGADNCMGASTTLISGLGSGAIFPVGVTTNTYRVTAANGQSATCSFTITVMDSQNPIISSCPVIDSIALNDSCYVTVPDLRSKVIHSDNCGNTTITQSPVAGTVISSYHNQTHTFTFTVTDSGGRTATCQTTVTAKDKLGPDIVCIPKRFISLSGQQATVTAQSFITTAKDNCSGTLTYQVRRMGKICGSNVDDDFGPTVDFCCDDVNDTIMVVVRVSDLRGNFTDCMDTVIVRDLVAPTIIHKLPDVTISCEYMYNINNLSEFGIYEHQDSVRKSFTITDPSNPNSPTIYQNGVFNENCPGTIIYENRNTLGLNMCNVGRIARHFLFKDAADNQRNIDTQYIYVVDFHKFDENDITWPPAQVDYFDCQRAVPDTTVTKSPALRNDKCSQTAATFVDQPFNNPAYCKAILRTWTVIDWCQYKTNTPGSPGKWTYDQTIVIRDTVAPQVTFHLPDFTLCTSNDECISAPMGFRRTQATDNCTPNNQLLWSYKLDLFNDGGTPEFSGKDESIVRSFPIGDHKFIWEVRDLCGNTATTTYLVKVRDCKGPNVVVMKGLATTLMPVMNMVSVKAKFFDNFSSDNCTSAQQLKFSYSPDINDTLRIFNCDSLGTRTVYIWVTDLAGNQTQTATTIDIQDNHKTCGPTALLDISGSIYTENGKFVSDTKVKIDGGETEREVMTDKSGKYTFSNLAKLNDYEIKPEKNTGHLDGITTLDLVIMQRHILGLKTLDSPYKLIAADINNSKSVTAADLVELRKVVLGVESEFRFNTSWRFVDAGHKFADTKEPWIFSSKMQYYNLDQNMKKSDFIAIKIGDVNGSISEKLTQQTTNRTGDKWLINIEDVRVSTGEIVVVPVYSDMMDQLSGVQWTMEVKPGLVYTGVEAAAYGVNDENIGILEKNGKQFITIAYHHTNDTDNNTRKELFNLVFVANKNADLSSLLKFSSDITPALAITKGLEERSIGFSFTTKVPDEAFINQNQPNPFRGETMIQMSLKKPSMTQISIYDVKGSAVYSGVENLSSGNQSITIGSKHLGNQTGIFYCKIKNNEVSKVIKMLRIE